MTQEILAVFQTRPNLLVSWHAMRGVAQVLIKARGLDGVVFWLPAMAGREIPRHTIGKYERKKGKNALNGSL